MPVLASHINVQIVPPVALRKRHVLILLRDSNQKFILGQKKVYPAGIYRMIGGGVEGEENFPSAATRELYEELHIFVETEKLTELAQVKFSITDQEKQNYLFTTNVYFADIDSAKMRPSSELSGIKRMTEAELKALVFRYSQLPKEIDPLHHFSWYDYGQIYGKLHEIALKAVKPPRDLLFIA